jgi:UDP-glucose 4-epimerase
MKETRMNKLIFSSTAGVYGASKKMPLTEASEVTPTSYYAWSKYFLEEIIKASSVYKIKSVILRYFNAAGAALDGSLGEDHEPETHLIPKVIKTALGEKEKFLILGGDYETPDGTAVRDYVHVEDLAKAHILALEKLIDSNFDWEIYNVGTGKGYSVKEVIEVVKKVSGVDFPVEIGARRPGDWAKAYADSSKIKKDLGWQAKYGLQEIIESAFLWHKTHPQGFK